MHAFPTKRTVAPFTGAWIEIITPIFWRLKPSRSRPSRARGLKFILLLINSERVPVAPFTGAWIEIYCKRRTSIGHQQVAPFTGAWIEMPDGPLFRMLWTVAPFTGAWIEIITSSSRVFCVTRSRPSRARGLKLSERPA